MSYAKTYDDYGQPVPAYPTASDAHAQNAARQQHGGMPQAQQYNAGQQQQYAHPNNIPVVVQPIQGGQQDPYAPRARRQPPPIGKWADGICDWPSNIFPSCYCTCCILNGVWIVSQMAEKVGMMKFKYSIMAYSAVWLLALIIQLATGSSAVVYLPFMYVMGLAIALRLHIVKHHQITECSTNPGCASCGECCWGFCCHCCSVCQMARYIYGYDKVYDGDADVYRGDNWAV